MSRKGAFAVRKNVDQNMKAPAAKSDGEPFEAEEPKQKENNKPKYEAVADAVEAHDVGRK